MDHPQSIAHYRITGKLGEGGMGAVYRATDTKLARDVAIKVLPDAYAKDPDRLMRFTREAQMLASLNHPNIAAIHGIEERAIIMELVEGPTLAERIAQGPLPLDEALPISRQIAEALETAHEKGIIHRDLKPANIKLTADGKVKVLDFGLAKLSDPTEANEDPASAPTIIRGNSPTLAGVIIGTAGYMSPEQARGKRVDKRTDIWAFGVVLYEMLTGKELFGGGETVTDLLAAVVTREPDWSLLPSGTPPSIQRLAERCLRKDLKTRLRDIGEARILLDGPLEEPAPARPPKAAQWPLAATAAALAITLIVAAVGWYRATRPAPPRQLMRLNIDLDESTPPSRIEIIPGIGGNMIAFSPDGARVALTLRGADGKVRLHTRLLNQDQVKPLAGTENAYAPFFSPSGDWIAFFADDKLKKIPVEGGIVETLCNASKAFGGSWGDDGNIIAALNQSDGLSRIPSAGGTPVPVTKLNPGEVTHRWPLVLPGSQAVLFTASGQLIDYDSATIDVVSLKTGQRKTIHHGGFYPRYLADRSGANGAGHLIYLNAATLFAVPFDLGRLALAGEQLRRDDIPTQLTASSSPSSLPRPATPAPP